MFSLSHYRDEWFGNIRADLLSGLVVALALIPEAIAFSIIAGVDPKVGLYASFSIAVIVAITGGRPGMISAATAATAVLMVTLVKEHGLQYLLAATVLAGLLQIAAGVLRLGASDALRLPLGHHRLRQRPGDPDLHGAASRADRRALNLTYVMVAAGLAIIYLFPRLTRAVPVAAGLHPGADGGDAWRFDLDLRTVGDMGALPDAPCRSSCMPDIPLTSRDPGRSSCPTRPRWAAVGLLESLMTATHRRRPDRHPQRQATSECIGQGHRQHLPPASSAAWPAAP